MTTAAKAKCAAKVSGWRGWHRYGCAKYAVRDGYCGIHHPDAVARRNARASERWSARREAIDAQIAEQIERFRRAGCFDDLLAACKAAERLAWEVGCETDDGVPTLLADSRGDLYRQLSSAIAKAEGRS